MGVSIKYASRKKSEADLKRAFWNFLERRASQDLDLDVARGIVEKMCEVANLVVEDMETVGELNRIGFARRHWYNLELSIGEDKIVVQNSLEGAGSSPPHPPTRAQLWLGIYLSRLCA